MKSKIIRYLFFAFSFTIPLSQLVSSRLLILIVILSFFTTNERFSLNAFLRQSWDILLFYLVLLFGMVYTENTSLGWRQLETNLSLVGVPILLFFLRSFSKKSLTDFFCAFAGGVLTASIVCLVYALIKYRSFQSVNVFYYSELTQPIDLQPTYFAYYLILAITVTLYHFYYELPKKYLMISCVLIVFFFVILLLTGGQTAFISLLFVFSFFLSKYLVDRNSKRESVAVVLIVVLISIMAYSTSRTREWAEGKNDYWDRMVLWKSAISASPNYLLGVGTGDYTDGLNDYYRKNNLERYAQNSFNSHSQYIQLFFSNGILGLLTLIIMLSRPLYLSVKFQDLIGVLVFFPFLLYGVTEVFLGRYQGVIFFGVLHQALIKYYFSMWPSYLAKVDNFRTNKL